MKIAILPKAIYRFIAILIKLPLVSSQNWGKKKQLLFSTILTKCFKNVVKVVKQMFRSIINK